MSKRRNIEIDGVTYCACKEARVMDGGSEGVSRYPWYACVLGVGCEIDERVPDGYFRTMRECHEAIRAHVAASKATPCECCARPFTRRDNDFRGWDCRGAILCTTCGEGGNDSGAWMARRDARAHAVDVFDEMRAGKHAAKDLAWLAKQDTIEPVSGFESYVAAEYHDAFRKAYDVAMRALVAEVAS